MTENLVIILGFCQFLPLASWFIIMSLTGFCTWFRYKGDGSSDYLLKEYKEDFQQAFEGKDWAGVLSLSFTDEIQNLVSFF